MCNSAGLHESPVEVDKFRQIGLVKREHIGVYGNILLAALAGAERIGHEFLYCDLCACCSIIGNVNSALSVVAEHLTDDITLIQEGLWFQVGGYCGHIIAVTAELAGTVVGLVTHAAHT